MDLAEGAAALKGQSQLVLPILSMAWEEFFIAVWYLLQKTAANYSLLFSCRFCDC